MDKKYQDRKYQAEAVDTVFKKFNKKVTSQLIVMATGLGKTYVATRIVEEYEKRIKEPRVLFVAHREELIEQARDAFYQFHPMQIGIVKAQEFQIGHKIVVASVQTLTNRLDKINKDHFDLIYFDESHHYMAKTYMDVVEHFKPKLKIGLTATPKRLDGLSLGNIFDEIAFEYKIDAGIKDKWLCELQGIRVATDVDISKVRKSAGDFAPGQLSAVINTPERNQLIVMKYLQFAKNRQGIFFCCDMKHAIDMSEQFQANGINASFVVSNKKLCPDRKQRIADYKSGKIQILTNVMILTEGFDHPNTGCIGMVRPTQSETIYIQAVGRGTRLKDDDFIDEFKANNCVILDFVDNCGKHKLVNTFSLDKGKRIEERIFETTKRKGKLIASREFRERKLKNMYKHDKMVNLIELPDVKVFSQTGRMKDEATEKQINWLKSMGVWEEGIVYTKGHASELITNGPAKDWMLRKLAAWGYDIRDGASQGQYYEIYREKNEQKSKDGEPSSPLALFRSL